ncbi:MAG: alpha/beta fold hydrolase [Candidatus Eremiobacteraeota bacterium]|nr:alpha/beta fold hydrolase [Candidatus Eremiobacteraeota bacterium]
MTTCFPTLDRLVARDHPGVAQESRTIAYVHPERRERAIVLLHGMSATPAQFERLARALFERGHNVLVPRLPHHGHANRLSTALERLRSEELYDAGQRYLEIAGELGNVVTVAGFSLGGLLAACIGQRYAIDRCVPIAPFLGVSWIPNILMGPIAERLLRVPNRFHWWNPILRERQFLATNGYPRYATHAIAYSYRVARELLDRARTSRPLASRMAIVTNSAEVAVNNYAIRRLYKSWRSARPGDVELIMLRGFPLSHDIVSPLRGSGRLAERAHPHLLSAIDPISDCSCVTSAKTPQSAP